MKSLRSSYKTILILTALVLLSTTFLLAQNSPKKEPNPALKTPLSQKILTLLANEISGQIIFNNEVKLAGAPWIREEKEFSDTLYESQTIYDMVRSYGIETTRLDRFESDRKINYPVKGEFWLLKPKKRLVARLEADTALIAGSSSNVDLTGELIYIPPLDKETIKQWTEAGIRKELKEKIALMWSHANRDTAKALDAAGIKGVISFNSEERYFDPDQVIYSRGAYNDWENLKFGFSISWRQWSELIEDVESGKEITVLCKAKINKYQDKYETVFSWIPGTEPDKKGVIFSAHLFEGYTKRGANDNMSGCVVQLEILRALSKLISQDALPQPRRNIYFIWPNEISGTYEQLRQNPDLPDKLSININMDMVGEGLRKNNAKFTMSECPNYLPSYLDALAESFMNYIWRTNDIVYLPDSPQGRRGGQYFPQPMWEKNGSRDAFRYFVHRATGGSDHICFKNPSVAVPAVELNVWPDQWYHADTDTPDKSDPTQMKRVAFIGAAAAWTAANCTDDVLEGLVNKVSEFGYERVGKRELPRALKFLDDADVKTLQKALSSAANLTDLVVERETGALASIEEIYSGSDKAVRIVNNRKKQWELYGEGLRSQLLKYAQFRAQNLKAELPQLPVPGKIEKQYSHIFPAIHPNIKGKEFYIEDSDSYKEYMEKNPDALKELKLDRNQKRSILNFINGKRSITKIRNWVIAETENDLDFKTLTKYLDFLKSIGWITGSDL